jgi:hypothetical protein
MSPVAALRSGSPGYSLQAALQLRSSNVHRKSRPHEFNAGLFAAVGLPESSVPNRLADRRPTSIERCVTRLIRGNRKLPYGGEVK